MTSRELRFKESYNKRWEEKKGIKSVELVMLGDAEAKTLIEDLEIAAKNLKENLKENKESRKRYSDYMGEQKELENKYK